MGLRLSCCLWKGFAHRERLTQREVDEYWVPLSLRQNRRAMWMLQRNLHYSLTDRRLSDVRAPTLVLWGARDRFDEPWRQASSAAGSTTRPCGSCPAAGTSSMRTAPPRPPRPWRASSPCQRAVRPGALEGGLPCRFPGRCAAVGEQSARFPTFVVLRLAGVRLARGSARG
jgi:hypothetical protein